MAVAVRLANSATSAADIDELLLQRDTLLHEIVLHLNPRDDDDQRIKTLADHVSELAESRKRRDEIQKALEDLRDATGIYLKKEWNRVKQESKGKRP